MTCEFVYEAWGPHDGCAEFMSEPDSWGCSETATHTVAATFPDYPEIETLTLCDEHTQQLRDDVSATVLSDVGVPS